MGRHLVPTTMLAAMFGLATAAATIAAGPFRPDWWEPGIRLAILGGLTPMIYAVNVRIVPVFARRSWPSSSLLRLQVVLAMAGAWLVYVGGLTGASMLSIAGSGFALAGGMLFGANAVRLFRQPVGRMPAPPLPFPEQAAVDAVATRLIRLSGAGLLTGLLIGLITSVWRPSIGRWDLLWAHAMLVGFVVPMATGVSYHVLSRWTGRPWRSVAAIRLHLVATLLTLPLMLLALAAGSGRLLAVAGPLQATAVLLFLANVAPMVGGLPNPTRAAMGAAMALLAAGVVLGVAFALDPVLGAMLRPVHADLNLFGWAGLFVSGAGYYLVPRFAGHPLRWPRLAAAQVGLLAAGVVVAAIGWSWHRLANGPWVFALVGQSIVAVAFLLFAWVLAGTFWRQKRGTGAPLVVSLRRGEAGVG